MQSVECGLECTCQTSEEMWDKRFTLTAVSTQVIHVNLQKISHEFKYICKKSRITTSDLYSAKHFQELSIEKKIYETHLK